MTYIAKVALISSLIRVDSVFDFDTEFFRVWYGNAHIGIYRQDKQTDKWLAEPFYNNSDRTKTICDTTDTAEAVIIDTYKRANPKTL